MSTPRPDAFPVDDPALAPVLAALTAPPSRHELDGIAPTLVALRAAQVIPVPSTTSRRRPSMLSTLAGAKLGATIAGIAVSLGGAATVVYVSADVATTPDSHATAAATPTHSASAAAGAANASAGRPAATGTSAPSHSAVGHDVTGAAAHGLCTAWKSVADNGKAMDAVAHAKLVAAAGGADKVAAWCATVSAPGASADHPTGKPATAATGKAATAPTGKPDGTPTGKPQTAGTGRPSTVPTPTVPQTSRPTGRP